MTYDEKMAHIFQLFPELSRLSDPGQAEAACRLWVWFWEQSAFARVEQAPFKSGTCPVRLIAHVQSVVQNALGMAQVLQTLQHIAIDYDTLILSAVLHDVSKLIEYEEDETGTATFTKRGTVFPHAFWGAQKAAELGFSDEIVAQILNHPAASSAQLHTNESEILRCADLASAHVQ